mgnify:CR=1 FL=1
MTALSGNAEVSKTRKPRLMLTVLLLAQPVPTQLVLAAVV